MKCLRSGYCCINYDVIIVDNPYLGITENNLIHKPFGVKCKHLIGDTPGEYSCGVHYFKWYIETPCYQFKQIESNPLNNCRMGEYVLNKHD